MVLDHRIAKVRDYLGLVTVDDFTAVEPGEILAVPDVGRVTLDHLRMLLAARGMVLKNDRTPEYWQQHLSAAKIETQISDRDDEDDKAIVTPFTILIDSAEQQPFAFLGMKADADQQGRPLIVQTEWRPLGRHPDQLGDYSVDGFVGRCHVERKSLEDCQSTILGFGDRRERFEQELANLAAIESAMVVVEATFQNVIQFVPERGKKPAKDKAKILTRSILAYMQDYKVPFLFCDGRRLAEIATFRFLERFYRKHSQKNKDLERLVSAM